MRERPVDALTKIFSIVACALFVLGLLDTPRADLSIAPSTAALAPSEPRAALTVDVSTENGAPLADALVRVFRERDGNEYEVGSATTAQGGRMLLRDLPQGPVWLLAEHAGFARSVQALALEAISSRRVILVPEATLRVQVTDERGAPLARATVLVAGDDPIPFGALTDAKGTASVRRLPHGPWSVSAAARGYETAERAGVNGPVTLSLRLLASLEVRVTHRDGTNAPNARVSIAGSSLWPARTTLADMEGHCRIAGLLGGAYDLRATLGSEISEPLVGYTLERGAEATVTLVLEPGRFVTAIVTDGDGEHPGLVAGADVVLTPDGVASFPLLGRTAANGRVTLGPVGHGPASLGARAEGFVSGALVSVPPNTTEPVTVPLVRGATLRGEVVDVRGFPIEGATIDIAGTDAFGLPVSESPLTAAFRSTHFAWALNGPAPLVPAGELGVVPGPVPPIPPAGARIDPGADVWALATASAPHVEAWVTNASGSFTAHPVTPGRVHAVARHPDYVEGSSASVTLGPGGEARVKIVLHAGGTLAGRVLDDRSLPVEGAAIEVAGTSTALTRTAMTERDGTFELAGLPADVTLSVRRPGERRVALRKSIDVKENQRTTLELTLPARREGVRFKVVNERGDPVELASVSVLSVDPDTVLHETLFTDAEGTAEIPDARGLPLRLIVESPGFPRKVATVDHAPELVHIALEPGVLVEGSVTAVRGRQAVQGALVTLVSEGTRRTGRTDAEGRYRFADIAASNVHVTVDHADYASESFDAQVEPTSRADRPFELKTVDLSEPGSAEGDVLDPEGNPVAGARVAVGSAPSFVTTGALPSGMVEADARGHFVLTRIAEGRQTLEAVSPLAGRGRAVVEIRAGRVTDGTRIVLSGKPGEEAPEGGNVAVTLGERGSGDALEVVVVAVAPASEAERSGLATGDVLTKVDGVKPKTMGDARRRLGGRPGTDVVVEVTRGARHEALRVPREMARQ